MTSIDNDVLTTGAHIDKDVQVTVEGGQWLLCQ